ncbi:MAG TPA: ATP synthase F1 subunit gamma [Acidimicrobiales bacterium]|nr:ATP synthase F1 subunit gamma [Acidimicrobiales bacterium]
MAGGQERLLRRRIKSVEATKKITRAMELIAASQMGRARARLLGTRPYVHAVERVLAMSAEDATHASRILGVPETVERSLLVTIVGDRGLCGAYNSSVLRFAERLMLTGEQKGTTYRTVCVGKKAIAFFRYRNRAVDHVFTGMSDRPTFEDARRVAAEVIRPFIAGEVDMVELISTRFVSTGTQVVERRQILPLVVDDDEIEGEEPSHADGFYDFEPSSEELLELLVPQYAEVFLYQALLEASASEHTARQRAMAAATENAEELATTLSRIMNRARQDSITTEIMEIVSGAEALRTAGKAVSEELLRDDNEEQIA